MHIAIWIITFLIIGLWTLGAWGVSSLLSINGDWVAQIDPWLARLPFAGWLEGWFPEWLQLAHAMLDGLQSLVTWLGAAAPVLVWTVWGGAVVVTLLLAAGLSLLVALIKRNMPPTQPPGQPPVAA